MEELKRVNRRQQICLDTQTLVVLNILTRVDLGKNGVFQI
jgi:hypothetical protein